MVPECLRDWSDLAGLVDRRCTCQLLIGVGWNRCSALHAAETIAEHKRTKTRRFKSGPREPWVEAPDVADDNDRLFPLVGAAWEAEIGVVRHVDEYGAGDFLEIRLAATGKSLLVPFTREAVPTVDLPAKRVVLAPPEDVAAPE